MTFVSWNVNGVRSAERKGFIQWLVASDYDIVGIQETKVSNQELNENRFDNLRNRDNINMGRKTSI